MILVINKNAKKEDVEKVKEMIKRNGCTEHESIGLNYHIIGVVGDTSVIDEGMFQRSEAVDKVLHVQEPYKKSNRLFHPANTEVKVGCEVFGGKKLGIIAGPCSVESEEQIISVAESVKKSGARFLRGGAPVSYTHLTLPTNREV